jgi:transposase InsO family protein
MAYRFMQEHKGRYSVRGVRRGLLRWARNGVSERRSLRDAFLLRLIRELQRRHHNRYGSPRVLEALWKEYGERASLKKVAALLRENGLNARIRRRFIPTTNCTGFRYAATSLTGHFMSGRADRNGFLTSRICARCQAGSTSSSFWICLTGSVITKT